MTLTDGTIVMRPLQLADADSMYEAVIASIPEVSRWLPWCGPGYAKTDTIAFINFACEAWATGSQFPFGIFDALSDAYLGGLGINHIARLNRLANIGYWVRSDRTCRGIASTAVLLAARFAFRELGFTRLEIACIPDNLPSRRVAEKVGASFEVIARNRLVMHGKAYDAAVFSLVPGDLRD
jgi:RimJ/RimL family protein N-acetyltransferase